MILLTLCTFLATQAGLAQSLYTYKFFPILRPAAELVRQTENEQALNLFTSVMKLEDCQQKVNQMNVSSFTFFRGSNQLFFRDLRMERIIVNSAFFDRRANVWIQGDMHLLNAGRFDNDKGTVVYDVNDFDEAFVASYLYDVIRLAASIVLVARNNNMTDDQASNCVAAFAESYSDQLGELADGAKAFTFTYKEVKDSKGLLQDILTDKHGDELGGDKQAREFRKKMLDKWAPVVSVDGSDARRFDTSKDFGDLEAVNETELNDITAAIVPYYKNCVASNLRGDQKYFKILDVARRLNAGTGSLGTPRYYVLIRGESSDLDDARILDVKRQSKPSVYDYVTDETHSAVDTAVGNDANRSVTAYKSLVNHADDHLGFMELFNGFYSVRERSPYKKSLDLTDVSVKKLLNLSGQYGTLLANAHTRSSQGNEAFGVYSDFASIVYDKTKAGRQDFVKEITGDALAYASEAQQDYRLFLLSQKQGRLCRSTPPETVSPHLEL